MDDYEKKLAALKVALEVSKAIVDAVKVSDQNIGAPGGHLYTACMNILSLDEFEKIMGMLCQIGFIRKKGDCYFWLRDM